MALVVDRQRGAAQGNANPRLYALVSSASNPFHSTPSGNNSVPGVAGFMANGAAYNLGYRAGIGGRRIAGEGLERSRDDCCFADHAAPHRLFPLQPAFHALHATAARTEPVKALAQKTGATPSLTHWAQTWRR